MGNQAPRQCIISLPNDNILDSSKLKVFEDEKFIWQKKNENLCFESYKKHCEKKGKVKMVVISISVLFSIRFQELFLLGR